MRDNYSPTTGHEWFLGLQQRFTNEQNVTLGQLNCFSSLENNLRLKQSINSAKKKNETKLYIEKQRPMSKSLARERHPNRRINFCRSIQSSALSMR